MNAANVRVLVISGSMGSGKTTVLAEASDILITRRIPHAAIDLDALGCVHLPAGTPNQDLMYRNLKSVWKNYEAAGLKSLLVARAVEDPAELARCREAVPCANMVVCRLKASLQTMQERVRDREPGMLQQKFVDRAAELEALLDYAHVEDFEVQNEDRSVTDVAQEILVRSGWL
jgi:hypothetical protein